MDELLYFNVKQLPKISPKCAELYRANKDLLLYALTSRINNDKLLQESLSNVPKLIIHDMNRYHISLLCSALELENYEIFLRSIPWEYRAYHNQGLPFDYFVHIYYYWQEIIKREFDAECAENLNQIYHWLIEQHGRIISLSQSELPVSIKDQSHLTQMLIEGNQLGVEKLCKEALSKDSSLNKLFNDTIQPAMVSVGLLWEDGEINSAKEHLATATITKVLSDLYTKQPLVHHSRGTAIVTAAPNEHHELGAWMIATALESDDWNVHYLGPNTPIKDLLELLKETEADLLAISAVIPFHLDELRELIKQIKCDGELKKIKVIIGGRAFDTLPEIAENMGADAHLFNADDAVLKAREWFC